MGRREYYNRSYFSLFSFLYFFTVPISLSDAQNSQLTTLRRRENAKFCGYGKKKKTLKLRYYKILREETMMKWSQPTTPLRRRFF
jgi:hypothetical protein